jgi:hypothetical protein
MAEGFTVNSKHTLSHAIKWLTDNFEAHKYSTYSVRHGADRSIDQNALFHVWALEYGCYLAKLHPKGLEALTREAIIEQTKRAAKRRFYSEFKYQWMVIVLTDPFTGDTKKDFRSSKGYKTAEMFEFLTWLQATAINDGCLLESKGEFAKKQRDAE